MEEYARSTNPRNPNIAPNEVRVTSLGVVPGYVSYGVTLLEFPSITQQEKKLPNIIIKGMGGAMQNTILVAELIKEKIPTLHQFIDIGSTETVQVYEPLVKGLTKKEIAQTLPFMHILLSKTKLDASKPGYQAPRPSQPSRFPEGGRDKSLVFRGRGSRMKPRGGRSHSNIGRSDRTSLTKRPSTGEESKPTSTKIDDTSSNAAPQESPASESSTTAETPNNGEQSSRKPFTYRRGRGKHRKRGGRRGGRGRGGAGGGGNPSKPGSTKDT